MGEINTYPEMNKIIKDLLRLNKEPMDRYILARIEELENEVAGSNVASVRHGTWKSRTNAHGMMYFECSACGETARLDNYWEPILSPYCPDCGAKMDEEDASDG